MKAIGDRTHYCTELTESDIGKEVIVKGWAAKRRDFGGLIFVDLRDRTGILQIVFDASETPDFALAEKVRSEYVLAVRGRLRSRSEDRINPKIKTGTIEVLALEAQILADADTPPFEIDEAEKVNEMTRLKYRYLDLRTDKMTEIMRLRSEMMHVTRSYLHKHGFWEIETPYLGKSTPEGARDYLVPSRIKNGAFYALPQSPQLYKQLLMIGGADKYYQIARCFRDEDLRANRQPEFTQIDMEMSFVTQKQVMDLSYGLVREIFKKCGGVKLPAKIREMPYDEAMRRFGSDKPDTRFGLELIDISDIAKGCGFQVFERAVENVGGSVRMINAKGFVDEDNLILSRRDIDALGEFVKTFKAKGLAWISVRKNGELLSSITKFMSEDTVKAILDRADAKPGDILLFCADKDEVVYKTLGALRLHLAEKGNLIDKSRYDVLWVVDFPMFEYSEEEKRFVAVHHPFTMPHENDLDILESDPGKVRAAAYDLVINGEESGGGSLRIHDRALQKRIFNILGFSDEQIEERFGFFVNAFKYGAPPHGGLAFGFDRLVMMLAHTDNIKDVITFPKIQNASDMMTQAPTPVDKKQTDELGLRIVEAL
ncbi:MAG: aspartate--tRNA ligase [Clostridia bacterium]|jgi:aspartyl-tRNA synthetase|nr:aspartate--tRNA ligase [Clostridia bacterium]